jgi:hypothetical protein
LRRPTPASFDLSAATGQGSFAAARAVIDLDRDGWVDVVVAAGYWEDDRVGEPHPIAVWRGVGPGRWEEDTAAFFDGPIPELIHPRKTVVADFNGDGWPDLYVADHGLDRDPFPGAMNVLMLSDGAGRLRVTEIADESVGFHHGATAGDVDGDGDVDLVVTDDANQPSYVLVNDGAGAFERRDGAIPGDLQSRSTYTTELIDVDGDGNLDLFLAGHEFEGAPTVILWGDGSGDYSAAERTVLPAIEGYGTVVDVAAGDLDGDGRVDLVIDRTGSWPPPQFYDGYVLQVLVQTDSRDFRDATAERLAGEWPKTGVEWLEWVFALDHDGDGDLDLVVDPPRRSLVWWNDGSGQFAAAP